MLFCTAYRGHPRPQKHGCGVRAKRETLLGIHLAGLIMLFWCLPSFFLALLVFLLLSIMSQTFVPLAPNRPLSLLLPSKVSRYNKPSLPSRSPKQWLVFLHRVKLCLSFHTFVCLTSRQAAGGTPPLLKVGKGASSAERPGPWSLWDVHSCSGDPEP